MAGDQFGQNASTALKYKNEGNTAFQSGQYTQAEELYTKAIQHDTKNPLLYTNRAMASLKLTHYTSVIADSLTCLDLTPPQNTAMKAWFNLAKAQLALQHPAEALSSALKAHEVCVEEVHSGGKGASSLTQITEFVLQCKKERWELRERDRSARTGGLLEGLVAELEGRAEERRRGLRESGLLDGVVVPPEKIEEESARIQQETEQKVKDLRKVFEVAGEKEGKRREVPDWCVDDISFAVMLDPVVTKTGQSYDRASIMEHLRRSQTDPLTREPLSEKDLRPNLALKRACAEFLEENGWAVDW